VLSEMVAAIGSEDAPADLGELMFADDLYLFLHESSANTLKKGLPILSAAIRLNKNVRELNVSGPLFPPAFFSCLWEKPFFEVFGVEFHC
jgi:hypothetical protein